MERIWEAVKDHLKEDIPPSTFQLWLAPLQAEPGPQGEMLLACPNPFSLRWIQANYLNLIRRTLQNFQEAPPAVHLKLLTASGRALAPPAVSQPSLPMLAEPARRRALDQGFTFERFVVGASNRLAFQASQALARDDTFYNRVLFLASGPGLGKSHLAQAVGNHLHQDRHAGRILYLSAENFANEMVRSLKDGRMGRFKERFRQDCDVLLLEGVQFLSGKEKIQAELCYTLDTLMGSRKRLMFTSCYLPSEISHLTQELRSRFTGGVITPIGPPDFPTRVNILAHKAETRGVQIPVKVLEHLAEYIAGDVRRLESALDCLMARATWLNQAYSVRLAQEVLEDLKAVPTRLTPGQIQRIVGEYYGVSVAEMVSKSRQKRLVRARQLALHFCRAYTDKTLMELGRLFQRSHASVVHALQTLERDRQTQPRLAQEFQLLEARVAEAQVKSGSRPASTLRTGA
jgi:chromosomal replication initiator protein